MRHLVAMSKAPEELAGPVAPKPRLAAAVAGRIAVAGPAVPTGGSAESAAEVAARAAVPVERSDEHSARAAESVAEVDGQTDRIVQRDCHTRSEAGFEERTLRRTPNLFGPGRVVAV